MNTLSRDVIYKMFSPSVSVNEVNNLSVQCWMCVIFYMQCALQSNLDGSNTDGSFTMYHSNSFLSPYKILPIVQED